MKVSVDPSRCREYANCLIEAPEVFDISEATGSVVVLITEPSGQLHDEVRRAAASCPVRAITLMP